MSKTFFSTIKNISDSGKNNIAKDYVPACKLIFSSPASLSYNSPGALGFGVKRAGLVIPESVMLLVAPACCGRNSTILSAEEGYSSRMFYLQMSEGDLVSGFHLKKISDCIDNIILKVNPKVITICITCVDALLGTDLESICNRLTAEKGVYIVPTYMYALTREGRKPPMTAIRSAIYSLLKKDKIENTTVNILGFFSPLDKSCELFSLLKSVGIKKINQVSECRTFEEYREMGNANFNLVLNPETRYAADELMKKLRTPYIELTRLYDTQKILKQYNLFASSIGVTFDHSILKTGFDEAEKAVNDFKDRHPDASFAVGQMLNANPFELSLFLALRGFKVPYIFACPTEDDFSYIDRLAAISPDTKVYSNISPAMADFSFDELTEKVDVAIGKDVEFYFSDSAFIAWNEEEIPFGFYGVKKLFDNLENALKEKNTKKDFSISDYEKRSTLKDFNAKNRGVLCDSDTGNRGTCRLPHSDLHNTQRPLKEVDGFLSSLSPFAPDQSGAASVLYEYEGLNIICDAGGCAGNVSGFDEPRFGKIKSYMYSAGLRDMDAIMGQDEVLFNKIKDAALSCDGKFIALIGTPVPNVIGTDFNAYKKMAAKSFEIPFIFTQTTGMNNYDSGEERAYTALLEEFCFSKASAGTTGENGSKPDATPGENKDNIADLKIIGVWGAGPLDILRADTVSKIKEIIKKKYSADKVIVYGYKDKDVFTDFKNASCLTQSIVLSPSGLKPAELLKEKFNIEYKIDFDILFDEELFEEGFQNLKNTKNILIVHQQVMAESLKQKLLKSVPQTKIDTATFFMTDSKISSQTISLKEEYDFSKLLLENNYDAIIADPLFMRIISSIKLDCRPKFFSLPHYAVSGQLYEPELRDKKFKLNQINAEDL